MKGGITCGNWKAELNKRGEATIVSFLGVGAVGPTLRLPSDLGGHPVVGIGPWAFERCESIEVLMLPDGLKEVGPGAFFDCGKLASVSFPETLRYVGAWSFAYCPLTSVSFVEGFEQLGDFAFAGCHGLETVMLPASLVEIGDKAFGLCTHACVRCPVGSFSEEWCRERDVPIQSI